MIPEKIRKVMATSLPSYSGAVYLTNSDCYWQYRTWKLQRHGCLSAVANVNVPHV